MLRNLISLSLALLLSACVTMTTTVPEGYKGPVAILQDSAISQSSSQSDIFYASHIDGQRIKDSLIASRQYNAGRGFAMSPYLLARPVLVQPGVFRIVGRTEYGAPILTITHTVYEVSGEVRFTPEAGKRYVVRGELGENYSAVWIEEDGTKTVVGDKIEHKGSAKLGVFEK